MPIPDDPLQRWWFEASPENPERIDSCRPALVAFVGFGRQREPEIAGTGFVICGNKGVASVVTAKHVLVPGILGIQRPYLPHAPSALFVSPGATAISIESNALRLFWHNSRREMGMLKVVHATYNETLDLACCIVTPDTGTRYFEPAQIPIDTRVPTLGALVQMISFDGLGIEETSATVDRSGHGQEIAVTVRMSLRVGVVTGLYPDGHRNYRWPCFTTSIPATPGMSGGAVSLTGDVCPTAACGVVCADASPPEAFDDFRVCGESIIGCAWPALGLRIPESVPITPATTIRSLRDMMRLGIPVIGGFEHIELTDLPGGNYSFRYLDD